MNNLMHIILTPFSQVFPKPDELGVGFFVTSCFRAFVGRKDHTQQHNTRLTILAPAIESYHPSEGAPRKEKRGVKNFGH